MGWEERIQKELEQSFGGDGFVQHLDYGDDFMGLYICQNFLNCMVYYISTIPIL